MKKILSLMALLMVAFTTAWADDVKVTWQMGENTAGVGDPASLVTGIKYTVGSGLTENGTSSFDGMTFSRFDQNTGDNKGANNAHDTNVGLGKYVDFTFTPVAGKFTPTKVSFNIVKNGTGDPSCDVDVIDGDGNTIAVANNKEIIRNNAAAGTSTAHSYSVSGAKSSEGAVTLRIIIGKLASGKSVGIANVVVEGIWTSSAKTVTFTNDVNWEKVYVWAWNDTENFTGGEWPGVEMTADPTGNYTWSTEGNPTKILFNNGNSGEGNQTDNFDFKDGGVYSSTGRIITKNDYTATFTTDGWTEVWAYVWNSDESEKALGEWPGTQLEATDGVFNVAMQAEEAPAFIIFHNNAGEQTPDWTFENGKAYEYMMNVYTATFTTDAEWATVYAYAWNGDGETAEKLTGEWPGQQLEASDGIYTFTYKTFGDAPEKIQFNNGEAKTPDMGFTNGRAYKWNTTLQPLFALEASEDKIPAGTTVEVKDADGAVVATLTYGVSGGADFAAPSLRQNDEYAGFVNYTGGNGENGTADGGTVYYIKPVYDGTVTVGVWLNGGKAFFIQEDGTSLEGFNGIKKDYGSGTAFTFNVKAGSTYAVFCTGSKLGFYGFDYTFDKPEPQLNTYTATFTTNAGWEKVYAYAWSGEGETEVRFLGDWPGTELTAAEGVYTVTIEAAEAPAYIIFNNGNSGEGNQTEDLVFEDGKAYSYEVAVAEDYTSYIVNADLTGEGGFDATGTKGIDGSGIVKVGNAAAFDFKQTIVNLPAGQYKLTAQAAYRFGGDEQAEYDAIVAGTNTKLVQLYATVGSVTEAKPVMNRYDGASETSYSESGTATVNGLFVPNSSNAVKAWFDNGQYVNEVVFNLAADGDVTIGINRIGTPASDYTVIGPWTLTRLGDAEVEPEPETPEPGTDMTSYIENPSFETGDLTGWTVGNSSDTGVRENSNGTYHTEGCDGDYLFNTWWQGIPITQTVKNLPLGKYELKALMTSDPGEHLYLLANGEHSDVFGAEANNIFVEKSMQFYVIDGTATIGAIGGNDDGSFNENGYFWYKVDNFRLTFVEALPNIADIELPEGKMSNAAAEAMAAAKEAGDVIALLEAVQKAKESIDAYAKAKAALDAMKNIMDATNVYTAEAFEVYNGIYTTKLAAYNDGTMTDEEAKALENPELRTGWQHNESVVVDDLLLSAWSIGESKAVNYETALYINTWSSEGEGDGTNFLVPFFEYWTGDTNSLAENTLSASMTDVPAGVYKVSAWVRVRGKNDFTLPAYGITMQANDGGAVNVVGERVSEQSNFYLANVEAFGTVGEDGVLNIKFNVAADNNISWLSFQNVKFEPYEISTYTVAGAFNTNEGGIDDVIFGKTWTPDLEANDMVKGNDGVYTLKKLSVQLEQGTIYYKVVADHNWNNLNWGFDGNNADYVVNEAGTYDITFYFNPEEKLENGYNVDCVVAAPLKGDVNGDGVVGIGDIVAITNVMAGIEQNPVIIARANVNGDTNDAGEPIVGIGDIVAITNIMAGVNTDPEVTE